LLDQPLFLNMTLRMRTPLDPWETLALCQAVEADRKRERGLVWGPRTLDIDILLYENRVLRDDRLILPHPRIQERAFVLTPLREMDPEVYGQMNGGMGTGEVYLHMSAEDVKIRLGNGLRGIERTSSDKAAGHFTDIPVSDKFYSNANR
jgi:7,8-dihydro-6-hydroxymethylpterin-pyrophosphokinase